MWMWCAYLALRFAELYGAGFVVGGRGLLTRRRATAGHRGVASAGVAPDPGSSWGRRPTPGGGNRFSPKSWGVSGWVRLTHSSIWVATRSRPRLARPRRRCAAEDRHHDHERLRQTDRARPGRPQRRRATFTPQQSQERPSGSRCRRCSGACGSSTGTTRRRLPDISISGPSAARSTSRVASPRSVTSWTVTDPAEPAISVRRRRRAGGDRACGRGCRAPRLDAGRLGCVDRGGVRLFDVSADLPIPRVLVRQLPTRGTTDLFIIAH